MPVLGDPTHQQLIEQLRTLPTRLPRPRRILVISAHWEASPVKVTTQRLPGLYYDYHGFPPESYQLAYPVNGDPDWAANIIETLAQRGIDAQAEQQRGLDHGVFVPLMLMYPEADIPCLQLSLHPSLDSELHMAIGVALRSVVSPDTLVIGSGFSFHNMAEFFRPTEQGQHSNLAFEQWLEDTLTGSLGEERRQQALNDWQQAPGARFCHPREEHLIPLMVCYGIAGRGADMALQCEVLGKRASQFVWR